MLQDLYMYKNKRVTFNSMISISEYFIPFTKIGTSLQEGNKRNSRTTTHKQMDDMNGLMLIVNRKTLNI